MFSSTKAVIIPLAALVLGASIGYWLVDGPSDAHRTDMVTANAGVDQVEHGQLANLNAVDIVRMNNRMLIALRDRLASSGEGGPGTAWLDQIETVVRESVTETIRDEQGQIRAAATPPSNTVQPAPPTEEQRVLYQAVEQRIYTHALSGKPLIAAVTADPDFSRLTVAQQKRIAQEIAERFNNGEITLEQLRGR